jgi:methylenetetrahydrofolate dehydrogenase (NADP+) / methenyltetrahydrofolate cyclohydrolase
MVTQILNGKSVSKKILADIKETISGWIEKPGLAVIEVGDDPASAVYIKNKEEACRDVGIFWEKVAMPAEITPDMLFREVDRLNHDPKINGILVQVPLPDTLKNFEEQVIYAIDPKKDVDGFHPFNVGQYVSCKGDSCRKLLLPCTPYGIIRLLEEYKIPIAGKHAVLVGRSNLVGKPLSMLLLAKDATVTICHSKTVNLNSFTKLADILVVAVGKPNFIKSEDIKPGAVIVDVGINWTDNGIVGDVDFAVVKDKVNAITPVPGGIGPMTIAILLENVLKAFQMQKVIR